MGSDSAANFVSLALSFTTAPQPTNEEGKEKSDDERSNGGTRNNTGLDTTLGSSDRGYTIPGR